MMKMLGGSCNNHHMDSGRPSSYLQCPSRMPSQKHCSSAEPSWGHNLIKELSKVHIGLIQILKQGVVLALEPGLSTPRQGVELLPHPLWRDFWHHLTRRTGNNSWKQCGPVALKPRDRQSEAIVCRTKSVAQFTQEILGVSQLKTTKSFTRFRPSLLCPGRESNS